METVHEAGAIEEDGLATSAGAGAGAKAHSKRRRKASKKVRCGSLSRSMRLKDEMGNRQQSK